MFSANDISSVLAFAVISTVAVAACDRDRPPPKHLSNVAERFDDEVNEYNGRSGPPIIEVVADDTGEPAPNVFVWLTLIGPDGGDGGAQGFLTGPNGVAPRWLRMTPGRYQYSLRPHPSSRFVHTEWRRSDPYVVVDPSGETNVPTLSIHTNE